MTQGILEPCFLDSPAGRIFVVLHRAVKSDRIALFVPPFAEEMNKSRRMMTLAARQMAASGYAVLVVDLHGTGDSAGDFGDARWDTWTRDIESGVRWLATDPGSTVSLCGIRLGANLALAVSERLPTSIDKLLLWQPLLSGKTHVTQFLRLKIAAQLTAAGPKTSTAELRAAAANGETIEIAGYSLHPELLREMDELDLRTLAPPSGIDVSWFEVALGEGRGLGVASRKLGDAWRDAGVNLQQSVVAGEQFWTSPEITLAPELIEQTVNTLAAAS